MKEETNEQKPNDSNFDIVHFLVTILRILLCNWCACCTCCLQNTRREEKTPKSKSDKSSMFMKSDDDEEKQEQQKQQQIQQEDMGTPMSATVPERDERDVNLNFGSSTEGETPI